MAVTKKVFKSYLQEVSYVMGNGKFIHFKNGRFHTDKADEITALEHEIKQGHPHFYIDTNETETEEQTPEEALAAIKAAAVAEYIAAQGNDPKDPESKLKPAVVVAPSAPAVTLGGIQTSQTTEQNSAKSTGAPAPSLIIPKLQPAK